MKIKIPFLIAGALVVGTWLVLSALRPAYSDSAKIFISTLTPEQRQSAVLPFFKFSPPEWHFFPASMLPRPGVFIKDLGIVQKAKLDDFIREYLSMSGYRRTKEIMELENVLRELQPQNPHRIPENYSIAVYGTPHPDSVWAWTLEGHHLSLHFTVVKDKTSFAPFFFGTNPAEVKEGPSKGKRVIAAEEDIAFEFMHSLTPEQSQKAIFQATAFKEIVTANATQVSPLDPAGIAIGELQATQKDILLKLLNIYLSSMRNDLALKRFERIQSEDLDAMRFGWAGAVEKGKPHYYRIQGKTFLIEFDNIQNDANHIHIVWRDFDGDFGRDLLREHYMTSDHH